MNLTSTRKMYRIDGIFSDITRDDTGLHFMCGLEHAFAQPDGTYKPIVIAGTYTCQRGQHKLSNGVPFETFEILGVKGHSGILFHPGNYNGDSEGCCLTGTGFAVGEDPHQSGEDVEMVINSRIAFESFMQLQQNCDAFQLTVIG